MQPLRKFVALSASDRRLVVSAALWVAVIRLGLWVLPARTLLSSLPHVAPEGERGRAGAGCPPEQMGWAVRVASRYMPGARNCLVQALAAQRLLARRGHPARLCLGVAKADGGGVKAHAWLECEGKIVIGDAGVSGYTPLVPVPAPQAQGRGVP